MSLAFLGVFKGAFQLGLSLQAALNSAQVIVFSYKGESQLDGFRSHGGKVLSFIVSATFKYHLCCLEVGVLGQVASFLC